MKDNRAFISWSNYLRDAINNLKEEGYDFKNLAEMDIITLARKRDMTYDFYLKHNMSAFEWKLNQLINKDKNLIICNIIRENLCSRYDMKRKNVTLKNVSRYGNMTYRYYMQHNLGK